MVYWTFFSKGGKKCQIINKKWKTVGIWDREWGKDDVRESCLTLRLG